MRYLSKSLPAAPTKGMPERSSFSPGASPTNIREACGFPTPKTVFVLVSARLHLRQFSHSFRISSRLFVSTACSSVFRRRYFRQYIIINREKNLYVFGNFIRIISKNGKRGNRTFSTHGGAVLLYVGKCFGRGKLCSELTDKKSFA